MKKKNLDAKLLVIINSSPQLSQIKFYIVQVNFYI